MTHPRERRLTSFAANFAFMLAMVAGHVLLSGKLLARDATHVQRVVLGASNAPAVCAGLNAANTQRAAQRFPRNAAVSLESRVSGGIGQAPVSDAEGNLIILHGEPRLSKLDPQGRSLWSKRLSSEAACAPLLSSDGGILLITREAEALYFSRSGELQRKVNLPLSDTRRRVLAIPTSSAGSLVASSNELLQLDASGQVVRHTHVLGNVAGIAEWGSSLVAVSENGSVHAARVTGGFELVGSLGGAVTEGVAVQGNQLFALVDARKWVSLQLESGRVSVLGSEAALTLSGPAALFVNGGAALIADGGFVSLRAADGTETARVALAAAGQGFDAAQRALRPALVIADNAGAVVVVRGGSDALLLASDGSAKRLENTSCLDPFRPTPTRAGLVLSCRSGQLFTVSDKAQ